MKKEMVSKAENCANKRGRGTREEEQRATKLLKKKNRFGGRFEGD
jgi:hypothetical protein